MSRVLEFRVWDKLAESFIYSDSFFQCHYILNLSGTFFNLQNGSGGKEYEVQQYTGLKDKNGKMIFEGDIVLAKQDYADTLLKKKKIYGGLIHWNHSYWAIGKYKLFVMKDESLSVVGNIFENPELLKQ
jgi:uncharacterized phage protein (TIGR01671 family)